MLHGRVMADGPKRGRIDIHVLVNEAFQKQCLAKMLKKTNPQLNNKI